MKIAVIDLGTNTFNLLVGSVSDGKLEIIHSEKRVVKLAEGSNNLDYIRDIPYQRALDAISYYSQKIEEFDVDITKANATSGLRSAGNSDQFIQDCWMNYKIQIDVIDGNREAELIYKGVKQALELNSSNSLIMDIGGGSTEFNIINKDGLLWSRSYKLGASRLKENFKPSDPISEDDAKRIFDHVEGSVSDLVEAIDKYQPKELIGSSGSFDTLVDMIQMEAFNHTIEGNSFDISIDKYKLLHDKMFKLNLEDRKCIPGMIELRADLMPIACLLIDFVLDKTQVENFRMSKYSLKEGLFFELAQDLK